MGIKINQFTAGTPGSSDIFPLEQLSTSVMIVASTISAQASDHSFNDSGNGFITAGFTVGSIVRVSGWSGGSSVNNLVSGVITSLTSGKIIIGGADGDVIVNASAGSSITIAKWVTRRAALSQLPTSLGLGTSDTPSFNGVNIVGTGGTGYIDFGPQSTPPGTPAANHFRLSADANGKFTWKG
ncbi:MAG TPA: hypothetical protein VN843_17005, partial [Anaerolineales bacterium]|nr:hypothetical protein [Anaerolineales bacterium]